MPLPKLKEQNNTEILRTPVIKDARMILLMLLASRASILGMFPFGMAFFASCFDKSIAYIGITAISIALMTTQGSYLVVKYLVAALIYWIYTRFTERKSIVIDAACCGGAMLLGGLVFLLYSFVGMYDVLALIVESIVTSLMFIVFGKAHNLVKNRHKRAQTSQDEAISIAVTVGVMITGLGGINLPFNISLADVTAIYAVLCIALHSSVAAAGSGGLCIGFVASMSSPSAIVMMGIFGIGSLFANLLKSFGRIGVAIGFLGGLGAALLYAGNSFSLPVTIVEALIGVALFVLTPNKLQMRISAFFSRSVSLESIGADVRVKEYLSMKLEKAAYAFKSLEETFENASEKRLKSYNKDVASLFDEVADRVCEGCPNAKKCWQSDFTRTYRSIMLLLGTVETQGVLNFNSVPRSFSEKCLRSELFVVEFNHVYELYKKNLVRVGEASLSRDLVARQYREVAQLMENMSDEITAGFTFREDMEEELVCELDKVGIAVFEVSVIEGGKGKMEIYLGVSNGIETAKIEAVLSEVTGTIIVYDSEHANGLMKFVSGAKYDADVAIRQACRDYTEVSGDSVDTFVTEDYKQFVILSDGMGSGKRAMFESHITIKLLRDFLKSGFGVRTAIDMINSALCLKLDYECFSTVDLLCIDLMTGVCEFYKIGGAESIVWHGDNVDTVFSVSLPVGMIGDIKVHPQTKKLSDGDTIIMMTDGVSEAGFGKVRTEWLKKEIRMPFDTMEDMAQSLIENAIRKSHDAVIDDMTVVAIRLIEK